MKRSAVTLKDIARELGISSSTASRALNDHYEISEETKAAVREVAERLNYQPNSLALSLRSQRSNTIGIIVPELVHFFFSTVISGIEDVAHSNGFNVIIAQSNESLERELENIKTLSYNRVDGLLISISEETKDIKHIEALHELGLPVVFFDRMVEQSLGSSVTIDDFLGGYQAAKHLLDMGYRKIAHISGPLTLKIMKDRLEGYKHALEEANIPFDPDLIVKDKSGDANQAYEATIDLLNGIQPDAIFASNDIAAYGALKAANRLGKNVPGELGIVGFSNWQFTEFTSPSITTIEQPGFEIGKAAAELLLKQIKSDDEEELEFKKLPTRLIFRESTKRPQ